MREYNLFIIKEEHIDLYQNNPEYLFRLLSNLYGLRKNFNYGISLYNQLCLPFKTDIISQYLNERYNLDNKKSFYINNTLILLKASRIVVKSQYNLPSIVKVFNYYSNNIFVCDFQKKDYFWLTKFIKTKSLEYI